MARLFANEAHLHQELIDHIASLPPLLRGGADAYPVVWGHELTLHDAGVGGGNGSADLLTVDTSALVWLIEVKFNHSSESGHRVWHDQLARYRRAIMAMPWAEVVNYTRAFMLGRERTVPQTEHAASTQDLETCLAETLAAAGRDPEPAARMVAQIAASLRDGSFGIMLVSDYRHPADLREAKQFAKLTHEGPVAYAVVDASADGLRWDVLFHRTTDRSSHPVIKAVDSSFRGSAPPTTPTRLLDLASPGARSLLNDVVYPRLAQLGWQETAYRAKKSAFDVLLPIGGATKPLLVVGTSELDAKSVERAAKMEGGQPIKINPRMKEVLLRTGDIAFVNRWMKVFHELGWRGRPRGGKNLRWGVVDVGEEEIKASEAAMIYHPSKDTRDHSGRPGDAANLGLFFDAFAQMVAEMRER